MELRSLIFPMRTDIKASILNMIIFGLCPNILSFIQFFKRIILCRFCTPYSQNSQIFCYDFSKSSSMFSGFIHGFLDLE